MVWNNTEKRNAYYRKRYAENTLFVRRYKLEKGCADCGWRKHHAGLEFDHLDNKKRGPVSCQQGKSKKVLLEEMALCEVVCGACHGIRTWKRSHPDD